MTGRIVVGFYACVHLVEAVLKRSLTLMSVDHSKRREFMEKNKDIFTDDVMESYTALLEYSHQARYKPLTYSTKKRRPMMRNYAWMHWKLIYCKYLK